uniref:Uncharacterized protein n=1 Tax=Plectus sambesii TaxID=2011161 RepID=A0A914WGA0_9BILA
MAEERRRWDEQYAEQDKSLLIVADEKLDSEQESDRTTTSTGSALSLSLGIGGAGDLLESDLKYSSVDIHSDHGED